MSAITIKHLQAFIEVAHQKSFRHAAERLFTTQPNISSRIATLEEQLDAELFFRSGGKVRLTPKGQELLPKAQEVLASLDGFLDAAQNKSRFKGVIRLGVTEMIVHSWLSQYLAQLRVAYPNILVELTVDLSVNLSAALQDHKIDLALQSGPFSKDMSGQVEIGNYPFIWIAAPENTLVGRKVALKALVQNSILTHAQGTLPFQEIKDHLAKNGAKNARLFPSTNMVACLQMTADNLGIACVPREMVTQELSNGELTELDYNWVPKPLRFYARFDADFAPTYIKKAAEIAVQMGSQQT